ncbi:Helix-turn-helix domain-containing protein [Granulicella pectinivorans]|jgi:transcriptional regulator with XRE-family HTH domain|uniref:Helix-turn-helix domain-containing protein n=1 Tax=Granulicella pectinivorans TaxID=474950 RepID=A0A1I6LNU2_9BACT|nr:XRE family transcriptional regulator [Granulicella pectinivorans]SFS05093.1 Helix-turn-helix domain-containing protein [Granulicella pectinivorans]
MSTQTTLPDQQMETIPATPDESQAETIEVQTEAPLGHQQVDPTAAEAFITEKRIGERIKHLRLKKSMGLVELGRHTGLSASFLSQLETGRVVPTLRNLARIAMVFSKDLNYFFEPEPQTLFRVHRGKDRVRLPQSGVDDPAYYFESLGYMVPERHLDPYFAEFLPKKAGREVRAHQHTGCEFLYLLGGQLDVRHGDAVYHVEPGDAIYFDANTIHSYNCASAESATALIVTMQQPGSGRQTSGMVRRNPDLTSKKSTDHGEPGVKPKRIGLAPNPLSGRPQ